MIRCEMNRGQLSKLVAIANYSHLYLGTNWNLGPVRSCSEGMVKATVATAQSGLSLNSSSSWSREFESHDAHDPPAWATRRRTAAAADRGCGNPAGVRRPHAGPADAAGGRCGRRH